jgi:MFS family permease
MMTRRAPISYLLVLGSAVCCYAALGCVIRVIPGYVGSTLHLSAVAVGFSVGAPALTAVAARPAGGRIADARGTRIVVAAGALAMSLSILPAFIERAPWFLLSRLLVGLGEGAMMSASVLWLLRLAPRERQGRALGHIGLANYAGLTLGPLLADVLGGTAHPQRIFVASMALPLLGLLAVLFAHPGRLTDDRTQPQRSFAAITRLTSRAGVALLLVNIGYVALLGFGARALGGSATVVLPTYAVTVILVRTLGGSTPDRLGGRRTLALAAPTAAVGLLVTAFAPGAGALAGVAVLGVGQALAVPALGLLALESVPATQQGVASGVFFAWFDAGVGLGGPLTGGVAGLVGAGGALGAAAAAVALAGPVAISGRGGVRRDAVR